MKMKLSGSGLKTIVLNAPGVLLTLSIFRLYITPDPFSPVTPSLTKAETRRILEVGPPPGRMFPETVHEGGPAVSPAADTCGVAKLITVWSKTKSAWKPM